MRGSVVAVVLSLLLAIGVARVPAAFADDGPGAAAPAAASAPAAQDRCAALLEVEVLVALISIDIGLLLPAVQQIREAAARCLAS